MPDVKFWQERFEELGKHSVGPGETQTEADLEDHRQFFVRGIAEWLPQLRGPVLDFGCGVGRWAKDLPRPYLGLDLTPEHLDVCRAKFGNQHDVRFELSETLTSLPDGSFNTIFTCTVLQHIVELDERRRIMKEFSRLLSGDGTLLSIEWAEGQRQFDWCRAVTNSDLRQWLKAEMVGQVRENGRCHTIWIARQKQLSFWGRFLGIYRSQRSAAASFMRRD